MKRYFDCEFITKAYVPSLHLHIAVPAKKLSVTSVEIVLSVSVCLLEDGIIASSLPSFIRVHYLYSFFRQANSRVTSAN